MAANHDAVAAIPINAPADQTLTRNVLVKRMPYALADTDDWSQLVETDPVTGAVIIDIMFLGRVFHLDATDTTTVGDGTSCLVTSGGRRYKLASGSDIVAYSVLSRTNTPPVSPSIGDAYLVTAAPTGAWSGKADYVAVYTARGWEFINFEIGRLVYTEDVDSYWHRKTDGSWIVGFGAQSLGAGIVLPSNMQAGGGRLNWLVENQTTNTPPGTVTEGVAYIIGSSPTDAWAGQAGKIANGESGAWVIYSPGNGWPAYDKSNSTPYRHNGTQWRTATGLFTYSVIVYTNDDTWTKPDRLIAIETTVIGSGGGASGQAGDASSFSTVGSDAYSTAAGGAIGAGGVASGGDINLTGGAPGANGHGGIPGVASYYPYGYGADAGSGGGYGAAGSIKAIPASDLSSTEVVTIGNQAIAGLNGGIIVVKQWVQA